MESKGNSEYTRTDLACEWSGARAESEGTEARERSWSGGKVQMLSIVSQGAAKRFGRPKGQYVTVTCDKIWEMSSEGRRALEKEIAGVLGEMLRRETGKAIGGELSVLVVGLGNREITADAIGPLAVDELLVTRHLREREPGIFSRMDCCAVSALSPGVLGQTGMEAAEVVAGAVRRSQTDAMIVIDALAARSCDRLACTVQLSDTGIAPGSGIGNDRCALTRESMGIPVIALGIPTVVDSSTLVCDALARAGIDRVDERLQRILENGRRFYVSPKEADVITRRTATVIARAINRVLVGVSTLS